MHEGARTPEELEALFEDAGLLRDTAALAGLFEPGALLATGARTARGEHIAPLMEGLWARDFAYVAQPHRVLEASGTALIVAERAISVVRRSADACWRYAITNIDTKGAER